MVRRGSRLWRPQRTFLARGRSAARVKWRDHSHCHPRRFKLMGASRWDPKKTRILMPAKSQAAALRASLISYQGNTRRWATLRKTSTQSIRIRVLLALIGNIKRQRGLLETYLRAWKETTLTLRWTKPSSTFKTKQWRERKSEQTSRIPIATGETYPNQRRNCSKGSH